MTSPDRLTNNLLAGLPLVVLSVLEAGEAQGHAWNSWIEEPSSFHALKAARHAESALLRLLHPSLSAQDPESAREHLQRALTRCALALATLSKEPTS